MEIKKDEALGGCKMTMTEWLHGLVRGREAPSGSLPFRAEVRPVDGTESVCSRLCGSRNCGCGGTLKGIHCVWSHYRPDEKQGNG